MKPGPRECQRIESKAGKNLKPYQGLKLTTKIKLGVREDMSSRKKPKTLSGIETCYFLQNTFAIRAGKNLKPYQGLKRDQWVRGKGPIPAPEKT